MKLDAAAILALPPKPNAYACPECGQVWAHTGNGVHLRLLEIECHHAKLKAAMVNLSRGGAR